MDTRSWTNEQLIDAVKKSINMSDCLERLGLVPNGGNFKSIRLYLKKLDIIPGWKKKSRKRKNKTSNDRYLKRDLLIDGYIKNECEICHITDWCNKPIVIELHHIDGNRMNNDLSNLQMLCSNCHSQTDNYSGKSSYKTITPKQHKFKQCADCGKKLDKRYSRCKVCYFKFKKNNPSICCATKRIPYTKDFITKLMIKHEDNLSHVANELSTSRTNIRNWCKKLGITYIVAKRKY
jgi:hypothetical protein